MSTLVLGVAFFIGWLIGGRWPAVPSRLWEMGRRRLPW